MDLDRSEKFAADSGNDWRVVGSPTKGHKRPIVGVGVAAELFSPASLNGFELDRTHFGFPQSSTPRKVSESVGEFSSDDRAHKKRAILGDPISTPAENGSPAILSKRLKVLDPIGTPPKKDSGGIASSQSQSFPKKSEPVARNLMPRFLSTEVEAGSVVAGHNGADDEVFLPPALSPRDKSVFAFDAAPTPTTNTTEASDTEVAEITELIESLGLQVQQQAEAESYGRMFQQVFLPQYQQRPTLLAPPQGFLFGYNYNPPIFVPGPPTNYGNVEAPVFNCQGFLNRQPEPIGRVWDGELPVPDYESRRGLKFSRKVFIGGIPVDLDSGRGEGDILRSFKKFGDCHLEWPGREARYRKSPEKQGKDIGKGYTYLIFDRPDSVKYLIDGCTKTRFPGGGQKLTYEVTMMKKGGELRRAIQIVPWIISDAVFDTRCQQEKKFTVFVGAVHGRMSAKSLATVMDDTFGNVAGATLDTDKYQYPIGSGRVTFSDESSFKDAILASFLNVSSSPLAFKKKLEINPYLEDKICGYCHKVHGKKFCRDFACFAYFCDQCWENRHHFSLEFAHHKPLVKSSSVSSHSLDEDLSRREGAGQGLHGTGRGGRGVRTFGRKNSTRF